MHLGFDSTCSNLKGLYLQHFDSDLMRNGVFLYLNAIQNLYTGLTFLVLCERQANVTILSFLSCFVLGYRYFVETVKAILRKQPRFF